MSDLAASATPGPRTCPWCAAAAADDATACGSCGAALAQRESLGDVRIPGLTGLDPALEDFDKRPMHLRGPSSSQGVAPALIVGAAAGGPIGAVLIGGVVAVAAAEYLGAKQSGTDRAALDQVGLPSELALQALEKARETDAANGAAADAKRADGPNSGAGPHPDPDPGTAPDPDRDPATEPQPDAAAADGGMSIWRDLPQTSDAEREAP
jgi:hypothetical protein